MSPTGTALYASSTLDARLRTGYANPRRSQTYFFAGALNVMLPTAESPPAAFPTLTAQRAMFAFVVPHNPEPILPVKTLKVVLGRSPAEVIVAFGGNEEVGTLQPDSPFAFLRHSTRNTVSPGLNPLPLMCTASPLRRLVDGVTTTLGPAADASAPSPRPPASAPTPSSAAQSPIRSALVVIMCAPLPCPIEASSFINALPRWPQFTFDVIVARKAKIRSGRNRGFVLIDVLNVLSIQ